MRELTTNEKTANRFNLLAKDAAQVVELLTTLQATRKTPQVDPKGVIHSALMYAAIVIYCRSFKHSNSKGQADRIADISLLEVSKNPRLLELHEALLTARDQMIAHSDWEKRSTRVVQRLDSEQTGTFGVLRATTMAHGWENINEQTFRELASLVFEQARELVSRLDRSQQA